jgi:hypothetical protein
LKIKHRIDDSEGYDRAIDSINSFAYGYTIIIDDDPQKDTRSNAQNSLYWLWNAEVQAHMAEYSGIFASSEEWAETICKKLRPVTIKGYLQGEPVLERFRTSKATTKEMAEFLTEYEMYANEHLGLRLPIPDDLRFAIYGDRK